MLSGNYIAARRRHTLMMPICRSGWRSSPWLRSPPLPCLRRLRCRWLAMISPRHAEQLTGSVTEAKEKLKKWLPKVNAEHFRSPNR